MDFTAYFTYIKNSFSCWCCGAGKPHQEAQEQSGRDEEFDISLEIHSRTKMRHSDHKHPNYYKKRLTDCSKFEQLLFNSCAMKVTMLY